MDENKIREICTTRLEKWTEVLIKEHCTPGILIGIGHDHVSGEIHLVIPEDWTDEQAMTILTGTLNLIRKNKNTETFRSQN